MIASTAYKKLFNRPVSENSIDGLKLNEKLVTSGLPQESTQGTFLVLVYINDLAWQVISTSACLLMKSI